MPDPAKTSEEAMLKPCPWCGEPVTGTGTGVWLGYCSNCEAVGPEAYSEAEAIRLWNSRAREEELVEALRGLIRYCDAVAWIAGIGKTQRQRLEYARTLIQDS